jgi:hypothetical protein
MGKHGLIKKARIEPQNDTLMRCCFRQSLVLIMQCFQNAIPIQTACGGLLQKQRTSAESIFIRPTWLPGAIIKNVMPDKYFPRKTGLCQTSACDVAARDVKYLAHLFSPAEAIRRKRVEGALSTGTLLCPSSSAELSDIIFISILLF